MRQFLLLLVAPIALTIMGGCREQAAEPAVDMARLRDAMQEHTETLYWIHLRLDTAATEISNAQIAIEEGNASAAEYMAANAYRELIKADEAVLDLGKDLQESLNLDVNRANRR